MPCIGGLAVFYCALYEWQGNKDSNLGMLESKSSALTNLAIPLLNRLFAALTRQTNFVLRLQQVRQRMR